MFGFGSLVGFGMFGINLSDGLVDWFYIKDMVRYIIVFYGFDLVLG